MNSEASFLERCQWKCSCSKYKADPTGLVRLLLNIPFVEPCLGESLLSFWRAFLFCKKALSKVSHSSPSNPSTWWSESTKLYTTGSAISQNESWLFITTLWQRASPINHANIRQTRVLVSSLSNCLSLIVDDSTKPSSTGTNWTVVMLADPTLIVES